MRGGVADAGAQHHGDIAAFHELAVVRLRFVVGIGVAATPDTALCGGGRGDDQGSEGNKGNELQGVLLASRMLRTAFQYRATSLNCQLTP